jgi:hypothetical protein
MQKKPRKRFFKKIGINNDNTFIIILETIITMGIIMTAWIFFRADSTHHALLYIKGMLSPTLFSFPQVLPKKTIIIVFLFIFAEWLQRTKEHTLQIDNIKYRFVRWGLYFGVVYLILFLGGGGQKFIYFQF